MPDLTLKEPTPALLIAMGDASMKVGHPEVAAGLYRAALRASKGAVLTLRARIGLTQWPNGRTLTLLETLQALEKIDPHTAFVGEGLATWMKSPPFSRNTRFMRLADDHADLLPAANWHWNLSTAVWAAEQAKHVAGDFVELGVFKGHTTRFVADFVGFGDWPKTWFLYDTFEGIPADQLDTGWEEANARAYDGKYSEEEVRERFSDLANVRVVKGRVPEVLAKECPERIAFLHVDLNNVSAEIQALETLYDRIPSGGVILFDDFGWTAAIKQQNEETAWFEARGQKILALPTGQGLFVKP